MMWLGDQNVSGDGTSPGEGDGKGAPSAQRAHALGPTLYEQYACSGVPSFAQTIPSGSLSGGPATQPVGLTTTTLLQGMPLMMPGEGDGVSGLSSPDEASWPEAATISANAAVADAQAFCIVFGAQG
jgi:hypothetical protein